MNNKGLLRLINLPIFSDEKELGSLLHIDARYIQAFTWKTNKFYKKYYIKKSDGSDREIKQPTSNLKAVQAWILRNVLDKLEPTIYATAYIKGKNIMDNVIPHSGNRYFIILDIKDFFPSISIKNVKQIFNLIGYSYSSSNILAKLCTCDGSFAEILRWCQETQYRSCV
jgi:RNA-directed DNA polymerase